MAEPVDPAIRARALEMVTEGVPDSRIAKELGVGATSVARWRRKAERAELPEVPQSDLAQVERLGKMVSVLHPDAISVERRHNAELRREMKNETYEIMRRMMEKAKLPDDHPDAMPDYVKIRLIEVSQRETRDLDYMGEAPPEDSDERRSMELEDFFAALQAANMQGRDES